MTTYNVGDFFLYRTSMGTARYIGVIIQKKAPVHEYEPRLLLLAGIKNDLQFQHYSAIHASLDVQDRLIRYINEIRDTNNHQNFERKDFSVDYYPSGLCTPFCGRLDSKKLTLLTDTLALEEALRELAPNMFGADPQRVIRFFQRVHYPFNTIKTPNLSL